MRFIAAIDTVFYGTRYTQNELVDTSDWTRKQLLQFLDKGLITPADINKQAVTEINLADLGDVSDESGTEGQILTLRNGRWTPADLPDFGSNSYADAILQTHIDASEPHRAYDVDMPSLTILFENGIT